MHELKAQLAPGWSGVNIALLIVLALIAWPLGLLMLGYIIWGRELRLDLGRPHTLATAGSRLRRAFSAGKSAWSASGEPLPTGRPDAASSSTSSANGNGGWARADGAVGGKPRSSSSASTEQSATTEGVETLKAERDALSRERQAFEAEKREFEARQGSGN